MAESTRDEFDDLEDERPVLAHSRPREEGDLDITPMIDITFLLLIFFIVASTPDSQVKIDLPEARYGQGVSQRESTIFTVGQGSAKSAPIYLADGPDPKSLLSGSPEQQAKKIQEAVQAAVSEGHVDVIIKAERGVPHREVARVAGAASRVDGVQLHFAVMEVD